MKHISLLIALISISFLGLSQVNYKYKFEVKLKEKADSVLYLANYYGDKTYLADTAYVKGKGSFVFQKDEKLDGGLYIVVDQSKKSILEFLVSDSRDLKLESNGPDYIANMEVTNSAENVLFYDYLKYSSQLYEKLQPLNARLRALEKGSDSTQIIRDQIQVINTEMNDYKENLIKDHPQTFLAKFFGLIKEASFPDTLLTLPDGSKDSSYPFRYYKAHYWDAVDLGDDRLIRTPVFHKKLDTYFDKVVSKDADSIIYEIDHLLSQMNETGDLYKFTLWHLTVKFDESQIMGHDAILVYLSDNYFSKGKAPWLHEDVIKNIVEESDKRRVVLIGNLAKNMIMQDTNLQPQSLFDIKNEYTIIYFWDPQCGHCKKESPKLVEFYNEYAEKLDVEVYTVCADSNLADMKKYIREKKMNFINVNGPRSYTTDYHELYNIFTTPVIVVLDKNKKIIAKRLVSEQLPEFIENHKKMREEKD
ncbi:MULTISPECIES: TlpA family protein disulfide reductase [unclassified Lentimicrobium]|uniref:TlpA family protein disulfide reductase n=1 Tax=unclassified Lentimicrobium TaxID=2677434 RepID=UPI0015548093|nr:MULTISPECIES: TlpA family protein disulfide reductase [unclassified Lentimicrobium]NPD45693.1 redoxin domain-containing protein [Lentimicrobium sp. S6]NPD85572.1 redoxin domain-containing protein [Lentimicrobium sp. L6]